MADTNIQSAVNPFRTLPELMKQILLHEENTDINQAIMDAHGLSIEQNKHMMGVIRKVILKNILPAQLVMTVKQDLRLDDNGAKKLALDLLGRRFLPMQWYIGNVEGLIKELGGDIEKYTAEAQKNYPEVYAPDAQKTASATEADTTKSVSTTTAASSANEPVILRDIGEKLGTPKGRAGVLLHLVALSQQIEDAGKSGKMTKVETSEMLHGLDALSYAVNTQDLNPLEVAAIKRRLKNILAKVEK